MIYVLKAMPEVSEAKFGVATSAGWTHPFVEYRADEALSRDSSIRFDANKDDSGDYWFLATKSGLGAPELHVTDDVMNRWKVQCHVDTDVYFP